MILKCIGTGSSGNCYLYGDGERYIVLDAGMNWKSVLKACYYTPSDIDALLVSHEHGDHAKYIKDFQRAGIDAYTGWHQAENIKEIYGVECKRIPHNVWNKIGNWQILPFKVPHNDTPNYAYIIRSHGYTLCYATDFEYLPVTLKSMSINTWLIECNHSIEIEEFEEDGNFEHVLRGHSSLETVKQLVEANITDSLQNIILCHTSSRNADEGQILREITAIVPETVNVTIAKKGTTYGL